MSLLSWVRTYSAWQDEPVETTEINATALNNMDDGITELVAVVNNQFSSTTADHTIVPAWFDTSVQPPVLKGWNGTAWVAIGGSGGNTLARGTVRSANYGPSSANEITPWDVTSGSFIHTLPTAPTDKTMAVVKIITQDIPEANTVTITAGGSDVFNKAGGPTTLVITGANRSVLLQYDVTTHIWTVLSSDVPTTYLDNLFAGITEPVALTKSPSGLPSYAPSGLANRYTPSSGGYNVNGATMNALRGKLALAAAGVSDCHAVFLGDSTLGGYNGAAYVYDTNPCRSMARQLNTLLGVPWQQGIQLGAAEASNTHLVDNWVLTGTFTVSASLLSCVSGAGTATRNPLPGETGTAVDIYYSDLGTTGVPWTINGVSQTALPTSGTTSIRKATVTGLSPGAQTIVLTASSKICIIAGTRVYTPATKALHIHNMSIGGSRSNGTTGSAIANNLNWASTATSAPVGLGWVMPNTLTAAGITPDFLIVSIGGNDLNAGATVAATMTGLDAMFGLYPTTPGLIIVGHKVSTVTDANQNLLSAAKYQHADSLARAMFNWDDWVGGLAGATADGLIGADGTHPNSAMQVMIGKQLATLIAS